MIIPVRCLTCGKPVAHLWEEYKRRVEDEGEDPAEVLEDLGIERYCCRGMFLGQKDMLEEVSEFKKA